MKRITTLICFCSFFATANAQRYTDLGTRISSPATGTSLNAGQPTNISYTVKNNGNQPILSTDSLTVYLIIDSDTVLQGSGQGVEKYRVYTGYAIAAGDSAIISYPAFFDTSFGGSTLDFCISVFPLNRSTVSISDTLPVNNKSCISISINGNQTGVNSVAIDNGALLYPNPSNGVINIYMPGGHAVGVSIYTSLGVLVRSVSVPASQQQLDLKDLAAGVYIVKLQDLVNRQVYTTRFVMQ